MKIRPMKAEYFHTDGETGRKKVRQAGMTKLIVTFRGFENEPNQKC